MHFVLPFLTLDASGLLGWASELRNEPVLQALLAALSTFVLEDPTTVGCGLLVADGQMGWWTAFLGVSTGIAVGDVGLFGLGRCLGPRLIQWGFLPQDKLDRAARWFQDNLVMSVLLSRFVPGMRLPTYVGAGILDASLIRFAGLAVFGSVLWTFLLLHLSIMLGQAIFPFLGAVKWPAAALAIGLFIAFQWWLKRRAAAGVQEAPVSSRFEFWPALLFYVPVALYYVWLSLRFRSFTLPTISNPSIYSGGLIGESKTQILSLIPASLQSWVAPYVCATVEEAPMEQMVGSMEDLVREAGFDYPFVAKPDVGQRGAGVRPLLKRDELKSYLLSFPTDQKLILQKLVPGPYEAGVLYYRLPGTPRGVIFSLTFKSFPTVCGDGKQTLQELILEDKRASQLQGVYLKRHAPQLDRVLQTGEVFPLVFAGNHCQGAVFTNGTLQVTQALSDRIDQIATAMPSFYFGRFDVKFDSPADFLRGENFQIVEVNGAGAEATHIWDSRTRLGAAYRTLFQQFRILFEIGAENRRRGFRTLGAFHLLRDVISYRKLAQAYPMTH